MTMSTSVPATIEMRRSRLLGLIAMVAVVAAGITWALVTFAGDTGTGAAQNSVQPPASVVSAGPSFKQWAKGISSLAAAQQTAAVLNALGLSSQDQQYVMGVTSLSPAEQAAAFGGPRGVSELNPSFKQFANGISTMAKAQQSAAVLNALGLNSQDRQYVQGITSLTKAQQAAAFGR